MSLMFDSIQEETEESVPQDMAAMWKLVGERTLASSPAGESVEQAVVSLLPAGPRTRYLDRALADDVAAAVLYLRHRRGIDQICLQCYQRCDDAAGLWPPSAPQTPAAYRCAPAGNRGWSFFLVEKTLGDGYAAVQAYLFHE
jgi:hypothetical protein